MVDLSEKKVLILGAGRGQKGLYKAANKLGIKTIAATLPDNNPPCLPLADEVCYVNILNPDEVESKTESLIFDGVATCCLDKGLKALGRLCNKYSVPGYSENSAELCNNKFLMKRKFTETNVSTAPFKVIKNEKELLNSINDLGGFPLIIKATDLAGSKGIYKVFNQGDAIEGFNKAIADTKKDYVIIEKLLKGNEFGAQAFIQNGKLLFIMPHGDILFHGATDVPIGHYVPLEVSEDIKSQITLETEKAIKAVGLDNCAVNIDFIEENGKVYVLELSGRIGANGLPELVSAHYGIDYYEMVLLAALGIQVDELWSKRKPGKAAVSRMIISPDKSGKLENIEVDLTKIKDLFDFQLFVQPGQEIHRFENSNHCIGQFTLLSDSISECKNNAEDFFQTISNQIKTH